MRSLRALLLRLRNLIVGRERSDRDFADELDSHLQLHIDDNVRAGMLPPEARRLALLRLGGVAQTAERQRDRRGFAQLDAWMKDLRFAARGLWKTPAFTLLAIATLALSIGANTAIFSVVDRVLLRPLPYPEPDRLAMVARHIERDAVSSDSYSHNGAAFFAMRDHASLLDVAASGGATGISFTTGLGGGVNLVAGGEVASVEQQRVSAGFFRVLGVPPALGREFGVDEDRVNGPAVAILSHAVWMRVFHGDRAAVGQSIMLRGEPYTIVGVMPASFRSSVRVDVWTPLRPSTRGEGGGQNYGVIARLRRNATWGDANGQLASIGEDLLRAVKIPAGIRIRLRLVPLQQGLTSGIRQTMLVLWSAVGVVLLIGCVNIAGLLLARGTSRAREIGTRMALGGGRAAIMRHLLSESVILAACGGIAGIAAGYAILQSQASALTALFGSPVALDRRILLITGAGSLLTSLVFGLLPALQTSRMDIRPMLGSAGGATIAGASSRWSRRALVVTQVALSVTLVFGAGLLVRTVQGLINLPPGFDAANVMTATLSLQDARYETAERVNRLFDRTLAEIAQLPGVERAAVALTLPYERALNNGFKFVGGQLQPDVISMTYVTPQYFDALRVPVRRGRVFTGGDTATAPHVAVVNEAFVRKYSADRDPLGRELDLGTIVGVVEDVQQRAGWNDYGPVAVIPAAYVPAAQFGDAGFKLVHGWFSPSWIVRTAGPQAGIARQIQRVVQDIDPQLPFKEFRTIGDVRSEAVATQRIQAVLLGSLSMLALVLAAIGIYGLVASGVVERTRELGIRAALGATPLQTVRAAAMPAVGLSAAGVAIGVALARGGADVMRRLVFGIAVTDSATLIAAGVLVLIAAGVAALVPALRILRMNVISALREA